MLNDCWPATRSWTTVDYFLRRTPAFHAVRRAMSPVHLVLALEDEEVVVFGINDTLMTVVGKLTSGVMNLAGGREESTASVELPPNASTRLASFPMTRWTQPECSAAFALLRSEGEVVARNRLFLPMFSQLRRPPADVTVRLEPGHAIFSSPTFAWGVCIDLDGERPLSDNFFDLYPGVPHRIGWTDPQPPRILRIGDAGPRDEVKWSCQP
jgi:beta-mannosidase